MTLEGDAKFEEELTCQFKIDVRNLTNFDSSTKKSQKFALWWAAFAISSPEQFLKIALSPNDFAGNLYLIWHVNSKTILFER